MSRYADMSPDERTAASAEAFCDDHDEAADRADEENDAAYSMDATTKNLATTAAKLLIQRDVLAAALKDIAMGAVLMYQPPFPQDSAFSSYAREVRRVALAGLSEAGLS